MRFCFRSWPISVQFWSASCGLLKIRQQVQDGVTYAKTHVTKSRPNYSFSSPRNVISNQSIRNCLIDPVIPNNLANKPTFLLRMTSSFLLPFASKGLLFCTVHWSSFLSARLDAGQFMDRWIKPVRSLKIYSLEFCLLTGPEFQYWFSFPNLHCKSDLSEACATRGPVWNLGGLPASLVLKVPGILFRVRPTHVSQAVRIAALWDPLLKLPPLHGLPPTL